MSGELCVLAVDDDPDILATLQEYFESQSVTIHTAQNGHEMRKMVDELPINIVLLDLRLPQEDGFALCRELRAMSNVGIIMLTGSTDTIDRVVGLEMGADDYIAKPFELREVLARVRSVHRRLDLTSPTANSENLNLGENFEAEVRFGDCILNHGRRTLRTVSGETITLGGMEYDLLNAFIDNAGRVLSREQLLNAAHGRGWDPFDRSIDVRVTRLRKKIEPRPGKPQFLRTVRGVGYIFTLDGIG